MVRLTGNTPCEGGSPWISRSIVYARNRLRPKSPSRRLWPRRAGRPCPRSRTWIRSIGSHTPRSHFRRWASPWRRSIGRCTSPRLRGVRRRSRSAPFPNRRSCSKLARHARARSATLPNARGRSTANSDGPGLHGVEHPIYDVWLTGCKGGTTVIHEAPQVEASAPDTDTPDAANPNEAQPPQAAPAQQQQQPQKKRTRPRAPAVVEAPLPPPDNAPLDLTHAAGTGGNARTR